MTSLEPLKTVISIGNVDDTSLALPSLNECRSGQRRVLEQVQTIRRTKSRQASSRNGSTSLSPTSPIYDSVFGDGYKSNSSNGSAFFGNGFSKALSLEKNMNRQIINNTKGSAVKRNTATSSFHYDRMYTPVSPKPMGQANTSRSEPDLAWQRCTTKRSVYQPRYVAQKGTCKTKRATSQFITTTTSPPVHAINGTSPTKTNSQFIIGQVDGLKTMTKPSVIESTTKTKVDLGVNGNSGTADITMKEAVEFLSKNDVTYQRCGASYIQHNTYIDEKAKEEVLKLNGIPPLLALLHSPDSQVSLTASAALRNLSFKNDKGKEMIHHSGGINKAVALLKDTDSVEIKKQLTGLLWNLSSVDNLKPDLLQSALPVLMERVILPYATGSDRTNNNNPESEIFYHATGCLRNLSSSKQNNRQAMRKCRGLVDSLVSYVTDSVDAGKPDDKSIENCVCILHNLTFQLEAEAPALFNRITALAKTVNRKQSQTDSSSISCFSPQSKSLECERHFDFPVVEDPQPSGASRLFHSKTLQSYLDLLSSSEREETQEACCGVMQNLTANEGIVSSVISHTIVQKLNGLHVISPLLKSDKVNIQKSAVALVGNLNRNSNLHNVIARKALPDLLSTISTGTKEGSESDDTLAMACQTASNLLMKEPDMGKHLLNSQLINSLTNLSNNNYLPKSRKAASLFLYNLWSDKELQNYLKKQGMSKSSFVNDITMSVLRSAQVVS